MCIRDRFGLEQCGDCSAAKSATADAQAAAAPDSSYPEGLRPASACATSPPGPDPLSDPSARGYS
eukprot:5178324-Alexandrium_andersonii.AAC.1